MKNKNQIQTSQMIHKLKVKILGWLLHHANREYKSEHFYKIKNRILSKYGQPAGQDVQFIPGKKCRSCDGSGVYSDYYDSGEKWFDTCRHCCHGWYKLPVYVILERKTLSRYTFHQPLRSVHKKNEAPGPVTVKGYIEHSYSKHGEKAGVALFLLFDWDRYWKQWRKDTGFGWRVYWWKPSNWIHNIAHLIKNGKNSMPIRNFSEKHLKKHKLTTNNNLPF